MTEDWSAERILAKFAEREWGISGTERVVVTEQLGHRIAVECYSSTDRLLHEAEIAATDMITKLSRFTAGLMRERAGQTSMAP